MPSSDAGLGDTTVVGGVEDTLDRGSARAPGRPALVLIWSRKEPARVGELVLLPHEVDRADTTFSIGRAIDPSHDGTMPLRFCRLRPHSLEDTGPLRADHVSRVHLRLRPRRSDGAIEVDHVGRGSMRVNGRAVERAIIRQRDVVEVINRFTLLCVTRPPEWPDREDIFEPFAFGSADPHGLVGESPGVWALREAIAFVADRDEHTLVYGPSGAGKELVVRAIHDRSARGDAPMIARNASTLPEGLIDAELFGNIRNYPNPGVPERPGLLGQARDSTLYLDEIGELPHALQAHLLRVMDGGEYQRLGESRARRTNARIIGATNRAPSGLKHDFLGRMIHRVPVPGLTERPEDIPLLLRHLMRTFVVEADLHAQVQTRALLDRFIDDGEPTLSPHFITALLGHRFTSHVRELSKLLWSSIENSPSRFLDLPPELTQRPLLDQMKSRGVVDPASLSRDQVLGVLARVEGVKEKAWRELGLRNRYQLKRLLRKLEIE